MCACSWGCACVRVRVTESESMCRYWCWCSRADVDWSVGIGAVERVCACWRERMLVCVGETMSVLRAASVGSDDVRVLLSLSVSVLLSFAIVSVSSDLTHLRGGVGLARRQVGVPWAIAEVHPVG